MVRFADSILATLNSRGKDSEVGGGDGEAQAVEGCRAGVGEGEGVADGGSGGDGGGGGLNGGDGGAFGGAFVAGESEGEAVADEPQGCAGRFGGDGQVERGVAVGFRGRGVAVGADAGGGGGPGVVEGQRCGLQTERPSSSSEATARKVNGVAAGASMPSAAKGMARSVLPWRAPSKANSSAVSARTSAQLVPSQRRSSARALFGMWMRRVGVRG